MLSCLVQPRSCPTSIAAAPGRPRSGRCRCRGPQRVPSELGAAQTLGLLAPARAPRVSSCCSCPAEQGKADTSSSPRDRGTFSVPSLGVFPAFKILKLGWSGWKSCCFRKIFLQLLSFFDPQVSKDVHGGAGCLQEPWFPLPSFH